MNFEEFKKRYIAKLEKGGFIIPTDPDEYAAFEDKMADIYLGLMIYSEWQNEYAKKAHEKARAEALIADNKNKQKIILPGGHH